MKLIFTKEEIREAIFDYIEANLIRYSDRFKTDTVEVTVDLKDIAQIEVELKDKPVQVEVKQDNPTP